MADKNYYSIDSYDKLFCKCDGTTTSFVDSSTANPKTITANGNATQLSLHEDFAGKRTAGFFNGTSDYVVVPDSADWDFGTGDFEVQFYFNMTSLPSTGYILDVGGQAFSVVYVNSGTHFYVSLAGNLDINYVWTPTLNTWYKCKVARVSGTTTLYIDDVDRGNSSTSRNISGGSTGFYLGRQSDSATSYYPGWIKNLTVKKASSTVLDMKFDSPATSPLGPAIYFDGTGDRLTAPDDNDDFDFGSGSFTLEAWINPSGTGNQIFMGRNLASDYVILELYSGNLQCTVGSSGSGTYAWTPTINKWVHLAFVRNGSDTAFYLDGKQVATGTNSDSVSGTSPFGIGDLDSGSRPFTGYMREIRISNVARYTSAFTPSQSGFIVDANTVLYIKGDEDNGVTTFVDQTGKTVTTNGDTKIKYTEDYRSCIFKDETGKFPYPMGSAKVDFFAIGSGVYWGSNASPGYLSAPHSTDFDFAGDELTVETYIRKEDSGDVDMTIVSKYAASVGYIWMVNSGASKKSRLYYDGSHYATFTLPETFNIYQWYHLALTSKDTEVKLWVNGSLIDTETANATYNGAETDLNIGGYSTGTAPVRGRMDNIRISKGVARYTSTFNTPEVRAFIPRAILI